VLRLLLLQAGLVAAFIQCVAAGAATIVLLLEVQYDLIVLASPNVNDGVESEIGLDSLLPLLRWIYLLLALGVALTSNRFVEFTAARIRSASRAMHPTEPDHATDTLLTQITLASIGLAILTLRPPPDFLVAAGRSIGSGWVASAAWSGIMSAAVAGFGATAQAARRALEEQ
jgi:hypothetical protein